MDKSLPYAFLTKLEADNLYIIHDYFSDSDGVEYVNHVHGFDNFFLFIGCQSRGRWPHIITPLLSTSDISTGKQYFSLLLI